ncbi:MAG: SsrA-binding protein SmpB [Chloroflexi bacterium]|nr:SsrA-binding protein SmpB [Chloroflexota bacterium]MCY3939285.1 SsrA-binding protein SmpB [Chloroflexota bacterium]
MARKKKSSGPGRANGAGRNLAVNRRARYDYEIVDRLEAGLVLTGTEIKSIRGGSVSLREGYVQVSRGEAYLHGVHIGRYKPAAENNHDPLRPRKLLLHAAEITRLEQSINAHRYTAVPLRMYLSNGRAKLEIGVGRGLKRFDKRERQAERDAKRQIERQLGRLPKE